MSRRQKAVVGLWVAAGIPLAVGAVAGLALSYTNVVDVVAPIVSPDLARVFPLVWDVVLAGAALAYLATAYMGKPRQMWRVISQGGVVGTILVNATSAHDWQGLVIHLSGPLAWAVLIEAGASQLRADYQAKNRGAVGESIPLRLWLWSPRESAATWLRMARRLDGEQRAARLDVGLHQAAVEALQLAVPGREGRRVRGIVRRQLRAGSLEPVAVLTACGWLGHDTGNDPAQKVLRAALGAALGQDGAGPVTVEVVDVRALDGPAPGSEPVAAEAVPDPASALEPAAPALESAPAPVLEPVAPEKVSRDPDYENAVPEPASAPWSVPEPARTPVAAARRARATVAVTSPVEAEPTVPAPDPDDPLWVAAVEVAADLTRQGRRLTRACLTSALRDRGERCSNTRAGELARQLKAHNPT